MPSRKKKHRIYAIDHIGWGAYAALQAFFCAIPLRLAYFIGTVLADCFFIVSSKNRRIIEHNLRTALDFDERLVRKHTRTIFRNFFRNLVEFLCFCKFDEDWCKKNVEYVGLENVKEAFKSNKGVLAVTFHIGNLELHAYMTRLAGIPTNAIWASHKNPRVEEFFVRPRIERGIKVILTGGAMKKVMAALAQNELVYFVIDHSYTKDGVEVDFLGRKAIIPRGVGIAAIKTGAPIIPAVAVRTGYTRFRIMYGRPVEYALTGNDEEDMREILQRCIRSLEGFVREYPDQWGLFRKYNIDQKVI